MVSVTYSIDDDINHSSVQFLLTDASVALTFISVAETTRNGDTRERNLYNARKAYETIQRLRVHNVLTESETESLDSQLLLVKSRLEALGQTF